MKNLKASLRGVSVEQFATLFEPASSDRIELELTIPVKTNYDERSFAIGANIQYLEDGKPFMVAEAFCHYIIEKECWDTLSENSTKNAIIPGETMDNLTRISVSTLRGIICAKTENTPFSKFFLPLLEIDPSGDGEDFVIAKA
ncbi:MAG: hypothetical protein K2K72_06310 [Duncaniella sp.]|nr:hypothetical protein [Duncaniella sp.]